MPDGETKRHTFSSHHACKGRSMLIRNQVKRDFIIRSEEMKESFYWAVEQSDNEPVSSHSTLVFKVHSKPFECDDCVFDAAKPKVTMKENQNGILYHSNSFGREINPLAFTAKDTHHLNGHGREMAPLELEAKTRDEPWNTQIVDSFAKDNEYGNLNSMKKEDWNEIPSDCEWDADPLDSDTEDDGRLGNDLKLEGAVFVERFAHGQGNDPRESDRLSIAASDMLESGTNLYTDKDITVCELPELEACYKETNYNIVKDIRVDEGMPTEDKVLTESIKDDCTTAKEKDDMEVLIPDCLQSLSLENTKDDPGKDCESKEYTYDKSLLPIGPKSTLEISFDKDTVQGCDLKDSMNFCVPNDGTFAKMESFVDAKLPMQNFGTRSFLRSFLNSLNSDENEIAQPPDQIPHGDAISGSQTALSTNTEPDKNVQAGNLLYNSKVDCGSITFNFNSPKSGASRSMDGCAENVHAQSVESEDEYHLEFLNSDNLFEATLVQCTSNKFEINANGEQSNDLQDTNSNSSDGQVQEASIQDKTTGNVNEEAVQTYDVFKDEVEKSGSVPVTNLVRCDEGELSFSNAGLITISGPMAYSGSVSLRSDTSAASSRSFAFPVLQSEWNSSPVRMAKADRRHFWRRKSWRSGLLCCRF
ncbi:unnamed protein product [Fraxinus pennsylvanica]|uniref:Uncharacterized protein n=1 Tax=Fraxinus pennsylvanica TaxID=56036 RepID=A0AAD1YTA7_9LAMI|nr:unnamed protein product [Fraxinus pennsylvanica]